MSIATIGRRKNEFTLYYDPENLQSRMVLLLVKILELKLDLKEMDLKKRENLRAKFMQINPQCTLPTLVDKELVLWDGRTILRYLTETYGNDLSESLYSSIPKEQAMVDDKLYFDSTILERRVAECFYPTLKYSVQLDKDKYTALEEALQWLHIGSRKHLYIAGNNFTLADLSLVVTLSQVEAFGVDILKYDQLHDWYRRATLFLETFDYDVINVKYANSLGSLFKSNSDITVSNI